MIHVSRTTRMMIVNTITNFSLTIISLVKISRWTQQFNYQDATSDSLEKWNDNFIWLYALQNGVDI